MAAVQGMNPAMVKYAEDCRKAMKGMGTNEKLLIETLCKRPAYECAQIAHAFKAHYNRDLMKDIESETSGDFQKLMCRLTMSQEELDATDLMEALYPKKDGGDADKDAIIEIITGRTNAELNVMKQVYQQKFGMQLIDAAKSVLKKDFETFVVTILMANRDEAGTMYTDVEGDMEALYRAGTGKIGTDEDKFINILCTRGAGHLRSVFKAYEAKHKLTMEKVIKKEFSGSLEQALLTVVRMVNDRPALIARQFEDSMAGIGTNEKKLTRLTLRYRDPAIMNAIRAEYVKQHGKSLVERVHGETSGDYRDALEAIIG